MLSLKRGQRYGRVGVEDGSEAEPDAPPPTRSSRSPRFNLQDALDAAEPPPVNLVTSIFIRAIPIVATLSWLATLLTLLFLWIFQDNRLRYRSYMGSLPFLSSIGAAHPTVFLIGSAATAVFYVLALFTERLLRATRVLTEATEERHLWVAVGCADVLVGLLAGVALVLLGAFNSFDFPREHDAFMIAFVVCVTVSGLLQTIEVEHLWHEHPDRHDLRDGAILKWVFLVFSSGAGTSFWVLQTLCGGDATAVPYERCYRITTAAAALEWAAAFGLGFYCATLILDLWPMTRHAPRAHPVVWADREGVRGVWVAHPAAAETGAGRTPLHVPRGWGVSRPGAGGIRVLPPPEHDRSDGREPAELLYEMGRQRGVGGSGRKKGRSR
ncbi:hypothetical protein JCM10449v2_006920 [Rhodotorula kratochvilovae]